MVINIDITSDVMCPWCIIGFKRLQKAMKKFKDAVEFKIHWQPFELNPRMQDEGENLYDWMSQKKGMTLDEIISSRKLLADIGKENRFIFNYSEKSRIYNTNAAHRLLHWAGKFGEKQTDLKLALFKAHFTDNLDVSNHDVLLKIIKNIGLNVDNAKSVLNDENSIKEIRKIEKELKREGITSVPSYLFSKSIKVDGSDGDFEEVIKNIIS